MTDSHTEIGLFMVCIGIFMVFPELYRTYAGLLRKYFYEILCEGFIKCG